MTFSLFSSHSVSLEGTSSSSAYNTWTVDPNDTSMKGGYFLWIIFKKISYLMLHAKIFAGKNFSYLANFMLLSFSKPHRINFSYFSRLLK